MQYQCFATVGKNLEALLTDELRSLGVADVAETRGGARFTGTLETAYRVCLWSRVANRVLLTLFAADVENEDDLYRVVYEFPWHEHFDVTTSFAVTFNSIKSPFTHSRFAALKTKDAIVDRFREEMGERPSVDTKTPGIRINAFVQQKRLVVSLDLSGESLHRRGYREEQGEAPIKENLAAAILLKADWSSMAAEQASLFDPMCGSGTFVIEAAMMAADCAPGLQRKRWGFAAWKQGQPEIWKSLHEDAVTRFAKAQKSLTIDIRGYDQDAQVIRKAMDNARRAGVDKLVHFEKRELATVVPVAAQQTGLIVCNPPYGERLGEKKALAGLYTVFGRLLKASFADWKVMVIAGNPELTKQMGMRAQRINTLYNGPIECRLFYYEVKPEYFTRHSDTPIPWPADKRSEQARSMENRVRKNIKHLERWLKRENISCYRVYDADIPEYSFAIDVYESDRRLVHVQEYAPPASVDRQKAKARTHEALGVVVDVLGISREQLYYKLRRQQKGMAQYEKLETRGEFHQVQESGLKLLVNLGDYLDTGLFLDHRITRDMIGSMAKGKRFLNLFCYTATATVHAAAGGAVQTVSVDMSRTYLDWARRNLALNDLDNENNVLVRADCLQWLDEQAKAGKNRFDLVFLDPPSFSNSKSMETTLDIQRDHVDIIRKTVALLNPGGCLVFSNNNRRFRLDMETLSDLKIENITRKTISKDFERNPGIHHCWLIRPGS